MSGGVDSSVAAMLLAQEGHEVIGVSMQVWDYRKSGGCDSRKTCCSPDDFTDARKVAASFNIPYYVFDFEQTFRREVIDRFVKTYQIGKTPNPCIDCNSKVKFRELRDRAKSMRCDAVATGHYARIKKGEQGYHLLRASYREKDQSYFLYGALQQELAETLFPVGHMTKDQVRELARSAGIGTAEKPESQDICFVSGTVTDFIEKLAGKGKSGQMLLKDGTVIGEHQGLYSYTVGQRRGIGIGGSAEPLYVLELDSARNALILGPKHELERVHFDVEECNWVSPTILPSINTAAFPLVFNCIAQVRSRHLGSPAQVTVDQAGRCRVCFTGESATVSPGQAAVFYSEDNEELLGGGRII
jgi:tRNA-uridine 2-sulfurtransferase